MADDHLYVAVWMVTYNHVNFIEKAIDSVIKQKTNFKFKLFIGDDNSSDGTSEICKSFKLKYPGLIDLTTNDRNVGSHTNGVDTYYRCFKSNAKYVALLEGDDYWNDENKLQKQVDFLEANANYVGCFHNTEERFENDDKKASFLYCDYPFAKNITFADLSYSNCIPTCSIVFRNNLFGNFPEWYMRLKMGDWPLHLLNAQFGDFWYLPKIMGVHRIHSNGIWMMQDKERNRQYMINAYDIMIEGFAYNQSLQQQLMAGKDQFINPPKPKSPTLARRGINFIKRITNSTGK